MELEDIGTEAGCAKEVRKRGPTVNMVPMSDLEQWITEQLEKGERG
jgi:hypothetical protein